MNQFKKGDKVEILFKSKSLGHQPVWGRVASVESGSFKVEWEKRLSGAGSPPTVFSQAYQSVYMVEAA